MGKNRHIDNRIREDGKIWCYDCETYLPEDFYYKIKVRGNEFYVSTCSKCRRIKYRKEYKLDQYPYGHWTIEEDDETKEQLKLFFKLLGYDTDKDIHQQFMEKHKEHFTDKK